MNYTQRQALRNRIEDAIYETVAQEVGDRFAQYVVDELDHAIVVALVCADAAVEEEE